MDISVVIPTYNEAENVVGLWHELSSVLEGMARDYEIIFVDDGSTDSTYAALAKLHRADSRLRVIRLRRNFGQTAAMAAGFDHARGKIVVTIDADLQNDPHDIPRLVEKLEQGYDIVSGWRRHRQDTFLTRRLPSKLANNLISTITGVRLHDLGCTLKAYRSEVVKDVRLYGELHRFIPIIASSAGVSIAEVETNHRPRAHGRSKYRSLSRTLPVLLDLLTVKFMLDYATRPIRFFAVPGLLLGLVGSGITLYLITQKILFAMPLSQRPLFLLAVLAVVLGVQFVTLGLLAEMLMRIYHESQDKPIYSVREILEGETPKR